METYSFGKARNWIGAAALIAAAGLTGPAQAQEGWHPEGPVNVVLHTQPGGGTDVFIRTLAEALEPAIGQPIVVVNAPGGGGATQMNRVRSAAPDGLTLGVNTISHFTGMLTNLKGVFSPDDFSWIALTQVDPILFFVNSDSPFNNLQDLVAYAREHEGEVNIGGFGPVGSMQSIGTSMLEDAAGVKFNWVGHQSTPEVMTALLGNHIDVGVSNLGPTSQFFESGRVKALGVLGEARLDVLPDVETFDEQGFDVDESWVQIRGVFGPADMPMELQQQIADAIFKAMSSDIYQEYARQAGVIDGDLGPEAYRAFVDRTLTTAEKELGKAGLLN